MSANILIYVDCYERVSFFSRIATAGNEFGHSFVFLTDSFISHRELSRQGYVSHLIKKTWSNNKATISYSSSLDVLNGNQKESYARYFSASLIDSIISLNVRFDYIYIWNGSSTAGLAIKSFAKNKKIKVGYFEISNLPKKIFVDPQGVNAKSWLYNNVDYLDSLPNVEDDTYVEWKETWFKFKKGELPQARLLGTGRFDYYKDRIFSALFFRPFVNQNKFKLPRAKKRVEIKVDKFELDKRKFVFLALQVSHDSQIKINSSVDNLKAVQLACKKAEELNIPLLIKFHPAEFNAKNVMDIYKFTRDKNIFIVNDDTNLLLEKSELVCVINSTVGLEAKLLDKEVLVFGRAIYKSFDYFKLKSFIFNWLVDIDYFSKEKISIKQYEDILSRLEVE